MGTSALAAEAVAEARAAVKGEEMSVAELFALLDTDGDGKTRAIDWSFVAILSAMRGSTALAYKIVEG